MNKTFKKLCIFLLCIYMVAQNIYAAPTDNRVPVFSYRNQSTNMRERIEDFSYWSEVYSRIDKSYRQMTRFECGWNFYLKSLINPSYEQAISNLSKPNRLTSESPELDLSYHTFNWGNGTFDFKLIFNFDIVNVIVEIGLPYEDVTGQPWLENPDYKEKFKIHDTVSTYGRNFKGNQTDIIADVDFYISYVEAYKEYNLNITDLAFYDSRTGKLIHTANVPITKTFNVYVTQDNNAAERAGLDVDILNRNMTAGNSREFGGAANPFGLSKTYREINRMMDQVVVEETLADIERRHEAEMLHNSMLEEQMREEHLENYSKKVKAFNDLQEKEDRKQAEYDRIFQEQCDEILSQKARKKVIWDAEELDRFLAPSQTFEFGMSMPFGRVEGESYAIIPPNIYGNVMLNLGSLLSTPGNICLDLLGSGFLDLSDENDENKSDEVMNSNDWKNMAVNHYSVYVGVGTSIGTKNHYNFGYSAFSGEIPFFSCMISGGILVREVYMPPEKADVIMLVTPALRGKVSINPTSFMLLSLGVLAYDSAVEVNVGMGVAF